MEGNNHLAHTPKMEEDKSKLKIKIGNLHNANETFKLRMEGKKGNCCWIVKPRETNLKLSQENAS